MSLAEMIARDLGAAEMLSGPCADAVPVIAKAVASFLKQLEGEWRDDAGGFYGDA